MNSQARIKPIMRIVLAVMVAVHPSLDWLSGGKSLRHKGTNKPNASQTLPSTSNLSRNS